MSTSPTGRTRATRRSPPATFGFDEFVDHLIRFLEVMGPGSHMVAVCQPAVPALAAAAVMAETGNRAQPHSLTLMAGPIDTRINPTKVNELAKSRPIEWFEQNLISTVPWRYPGAGRRVYPGFLQLSAFMSMNLDRHISAHFGQFRSLVGGDAVSAEAHRKFYDEYGAVMDLPAEFYLETVQRVFQEHDLPLGCLTWHGEKVRPDGDPAHRAADGGRRARRYLRDRPDDGGAGPVHRRPDQHEAAPSADRRRALWRVQRPALGEGDLSARARDDPVDQLKPRSRHLTQTRTPGGREPRYHASR